MRCDVMHCALARVVGFMCSHTFPPSFYVLVFQLCAGTDPELAQLFDLFEGLVEGGQGSPVPILAACADLPLNAHYRVRALTLVGNTFATVDASDVRTVDV
jgi:hypothetical protein